MGGGTGAGPGEGTAGGGCPPGGPGEVVTGKRRGRGPSAEPLRGSGQGRRERGGGGGQNQPWLPWPQDTGDPGHSRPEALPPFLATPCPDPRPRHPSHHSTSIPHLVPAPHPRPVHLPHSLNLSLLDPPSAPPNSVPLPSDLRPCPPDPPPPRGRRALQALGAAAEEAVAAGAPHQLPAAGRQRGPGSRAQQQVRGGGEGAGLTVQLTQENRHQQGDCGCCELGVGVGANG